MKIEFLTGGEKRKRFLHEERERERCIGFVGGNNIANDNERGNSEKMRLGWVANGVGKTMLRNG